MSDGHLVFTAKGANAAKQPTVYWFAINSNVGLPKIQVHLSFRQPQLLQSSRAKKIKRNQQCPNPLSPVSPIAPVENLPEEPGN